MTAPNPASAAQIAAADPRANVWLVANAGSGKTKVLTDRVARLLLRGVDPQNILCLTYTKAAAAEMQNRLFRRLGEWAMAPAGALRDNLDQLGEENALTDESLRLARQLFARAIETPGGIRIQTIHSFCAGLLRRFPLEAGVSPGFTELDDRTAAILRADILEQMAEGPDAALFETILPEVQERAELLLRQIVQNRADLRTLPDEGELRILFGLRPGMDEAALLDEVFGPADGDLLQAVARVLAASGKSTDQKAAAQLSRASNPPDLETLERLEGVFLFGEGAKAPFAAKIDSFPTKDCRAALGDLLDGLNALMARVEAGRQTRLALSSFRKALALHRFSHEFLARYEAEKTQHGWLDFDDFIIRATRLLTDPAVAPWVLYRLDGSIDHILVDEAQDTSPAQWQIIAALTEEFTAGIGARPVARSLFVVGDRKQSIYSFQGADVAGFDRVRAGFAERFAAAGAPVTERAMVHSFRSSWAVLRLVDLCFPGEMQAALGGDFQHEPFFTEMPGRVDLWPLVPKPEKPEPKEWYDPVDLQGETDAPVVLANQIAREIRDMIARGAQIPDRGGFRPVRAGDFLILVQRRNEIFEAIIRACKAEGLPIAGPDRLTLTEELAVRDLLALLSFLNTPEDDLSLAVALKSPLFGWDEQRLFRLAQPRKGYLWEALRDSDEGETLEVLSDLRRWSEYLRPYELLDRILTRHLGRQKLLGRLGEESADAIDELVQQSLAYERAEVPSLTGFLVWMAAGEVEVKRQAEGEGRLIRVMTVHGSKGLEAPVVILPDTADRRLDEKDMILPLAQGRVTWSGRRAGDTLAVTELKDRRAAARQAENLRLLYVALTRAKSWLIVTGAGEAGESSWYGAVQAAAGQLSLVEGQGGRLRHEFGDWPADAPAPIPPVVPVTAPDLLPLPAAAAPVRSLRPSDLGGDKVLILHGDLPNGPDYDPDHDPLERGARLHLLLEHLPAADPAIWPDVASRLGADAALLAEAEAILIRPDLAWIFGPGTLAEVELAGPWRQDLLAGAVDRLIVTPDLVTAVDFKSNRQIPPDALATPEAYQRQLGAYAHALKQIYPGRRIAVAILWTAGPVLMPLPLEMVSAALERA